MARKFIVSPIIEGDVTIGSPGQQERVLLGRLAEIGSSRNIWLGADQEFVALVVGKRGSGKSYTLGTLLEGFATNSNNTAVSHHVRRRGVLLLDPMGNFWTMANPVRSDGSSKVAAQHAILKTWNIDPLKVDVTVWLPTGFRTNNDPSYVRDFSIHTSDLELSDLADLIGLHLVKDPQGAALSDAFEAVVENGWATPTTTKPAKPNFEFSDLVDYLDYLRTNHTGGDHDPSTLRAVIRSLKSLERSGVFSNAGTPLNALYVPGHLSILMLPHRVGADLRRVITRLILRRTLREREEASQIQQRLSVEQLSPANYAILEGELKNRIPRSLLALDEAQELLGDGGGEARAAIEDFCLLGRNYGLSLVLATQRPTAGAISAKVRSQADVQLIHRLLTQDDIETSRQNLLGAYPEEIRDAARSLQFQDLLRTLERGQLVVSASHAVAGDVSRQGERVDRIMVADVRPRMTVHGGEVE